MKLVIEREKWCHGEGPTKSFLIRMSDHRMCCLGFFGLECGLKRERLIGAAGVAACSDEPWPSWLDTEDRFALYEANDSIGIPGPQRESRIAAIFAKHGVEVEFK